MHQISESLRKADLPSDMYPRLGEKVSLHLYPTKGCVLCGDPPKPLPVSKDTVEILCLCDGTRTFGEIIKEYLNSGQPGSDLEICQAFLSFADLYREGLLVLERDAFKSQPVISGSRTTFYPTSLQIELTSSCNLTCYYCYRNADSHKLADRLKTNKLLAILGELADSGVAGVELTGGEPLLHPDFPQIVKFCGERFSLIGLLTNGTLIKESLLRLMLPFREKMVVSVSLDSHIPEVHDIRRGRRGAFNVTCKGITLLKKHKLLTRVSMSVDQDNWQDVEATLLLARSLGADLFTYSPILPFGRAQKGFEFWSLDARQVQEVDQELSEKYKGFLHFLPEDTILEITQPGGCGAGHRVYAMDPGGLVRPCVTFDEGQAIFGSLATETAAEVFGGAFPAAFAALEPPHPGVCGSCERLLFCRNCSLRGLMASAWVGEETCSWLEQPQVRTWRKLVSEHSQNGAPG
jgi:radical SAM protein with 4Fe4S-binding SPASM domain